MASYLSDFNVADGAVPAEQLTFLSGSGTISSNRLSMAAGSPVKLAVRPETLTRDNYVVHGIVRSGPSASSAQRGGVAFCVQDTANYYYITFKPGAFGNVYLYRVKAFSTALLVTHPSGSNINLPVDTDMKLEARVSGIGSSTNTIDVYLDDVLLFSHDDSADPLTSPGRAGFYLGDAAGDSYLFDDLTIVEGQATPVVTIDQATQTVMVAKNETTFPFILTGSATDEEDGNLSTTIEWQVESVGSTTSVTFDENEKNADVTITNSGLTATKTASALSGQSSVLTTLPKTSGKWQFEAIARVVAASNSGLGVSADDTPLFDTGLGNPVGNNAPTSSYQKLGRIYRNISTAQDNTFYSGFNYTTDDVISVCLDLDVSPPTATYYKNGTEVGSVVLEAGTEWRAGVCFATISDEWEISSSTGDLTYPVEGFNAWVDTPAAITPLGTGSSVTADLSIGTNTITASATDSNSPPATGTDQIVVTVLAYDFGGTIPVANGFIDGISGTHTSDTYSGNGVNVMLTQLPTNGRVFVKTDGSFVVIADPNVSPPVTQITFSYRIEDQEGISNESTITIDL